MYDYSRVKNSTHPLKKPAPRCRSSTSSRTSGGIERGRAGRERRGERGRPRGARGETEAWSEKGAAGANRRGERASGERDC